MNPVILFPASGGEENPFKLFFFGKKHHDKRMKNKKA
jgi:hypothetical protein